MQTEHRIADCSGPTGASVFHLHPLLRCNLTCLHCYSVSSPQATEAIALSTALAAIDMAADWGYQVLAISGGEPVLYDGLRSLLERANDRSMRTSIVTNGLLIRRMGALGTLRMAHTVCVSIDGLAKSHDQMRARRGAFTGVRSAVCTLADSGLPVWVSCGVTTSNIDEIEEVVDEVCQWGARGINFHPVEKAGRAQRFVSTDFLNEKERLILYCVAHLLAHKYARRLEVKVDLLHKDTVIQRPELIYAGAEANTDETTPPSKLLGVLVLEADGTLSPISHGFSRELSVGHFPFDHSIDAGLAWAQFMKRQYPELRRAGRSLLAELERWPDARVLNPNEALLIHAKGPSSLIPLRVNLTERMRAAAADFI